MDGILTFLNSGFVIMLAASVIAAIGLFTWQRQIGNSKSDINAMMCDAELMVYKV